MAVTEGTHKTFRLRHGDTIREFRNVTVQHPVRLVWHDDPDIQGLKFYTKEPIEDRWELVGIENKIEAINDERTRIVEVEVKVGFLPENVVDD